MRSKGKMKTKSLGMLACLVTLALLVSACGGGTTGNTTAANTEGANSGKRVNITLLNSKGEILPQMEAAAKKFSEENPDITVEVIPVPTGQSPFERASALYASGNPTTITMQDTSDVPSLSERMLDLSDEKWVADVRDGALDTSTVDGKVYAFPLAMEGYSLMYNQAILDQAVGGTFDPASIVTTSDLDSLLQKVEATGVAGSYISSMDWSLGAHLLPIVISAQGDDQAARDQFVEKLKNGTADLANDSIFNGLLDTFDVLMKYNLDKKSPLSGPYERGAEVMGKGEVGVWFMGNWVWPQMEPFDTSNGQYAYLPIPLGNTQTTQSKVSVGVTKVLLIDKEKSTPEQQEAAKKFLNWIVYNDSGQDFLVNQANIIPAFKNITLKPQDPLSLSLVAYLDAGQTVPNAGVPADHASHVGSSMQKYLSGVIDRAELVQEIEAYWQTKK